MKINLTSAQAGRATLLILVAIVNAQGLASAQTTAFTYQGQLIDKATGIPVTGSYDMRFYLRDDPTGEIVVSTTNVFDGSGNPGTFDPVWVDKGLFTTNLNFGAGPFSGVRLWLQIETRNHALGGAYQRLLDRTEITPAPYAIYAQSAGTVDNLPENIVTSGKIAAGQVVKSLNGFTDSVVLSAGANVNLTPSGNSIQISATGAGIWNLNGSSAYYNGGNIGIGTPSPSRKLEVQALNAVEIGLGSQAVFPGTGVPGPITLWTLQSTAWPEFHFGDPPPPPEAGGFQIVDRTAGLSRLSIDHFGSVGIGTISPDSLLHSAAVTGNGNAVHGSCSDAAGSGVYGNHTAQGFGVAGRSSGSGVGVYGENVDTSGFAGFLNGRALVSVPATATPLAAALQLDVASFSTTDNAIASAFLTVRDVGSGKTAFKIRGDGNVGIGTSDPQYPLDVAGQTRTCVLQIKGGCDIAEPFEISGREIPKGSLVVIDDENAGKLKLAAEEYDTRVAGIVSGANGINPGISLYQEGVMDSGQNVALSGRVYALADASHGTIKPGDLLTSSSTPGHVMKVSDHSRAQGAIIGKAMSSLKQGKGMVLVLVSLQ